MSEKLYANLDQLNEYRKIIKERLGMNPAVFDNMKEIVDRSPELVNTILNHYEKLDKNESIRPDLPNDMQILYMRDRQTFTFLMFPELLEMGYEVGHLIGEKFIAPFITGNNLKEIMESNLHFATDHNYAFQEIVEVDDKHAIYRNHQCADCYGIPNIGMKICCYEAGTAAGSFETPLGKKVKVTETKCCANGDEYCEFYVEVLD